MIDGQKNNYLFIVSLMILATATLFSITVNTYDSLVIAALGLTAAFFKKNKLAYSDRTIIYGVLACLVTSVASDMAFPLDKNNFLLVGGVFSTNVSAPLMIFLAVAMTFFIFNEYALGFCVSFCLIVIMLTSDIMYNERSGAFIRNYIYIYLGAVFIVIAATMLLLQMNKITFHPGAKKTTRPRRRKKRILISCALIAMLVFSAASLSLFRQNEKNLKLLDSVLTKIMMSTMYRHNFIVFNREVNLNRTIDQTILNNSDKIVIRAISKSPPGYLRGRAYNRYSAGKWKDSEMEMRKLKILKNEQFLTFNTFVANENTDYSSDRQIEFLPGEKFFTDVLLVPGNSDAFDISAGSVMSNSDGIYSPTEWEMRTGVTAYLPEIRQDSAFQGPADCMESGYLEIPQNVTRPIKQFISDALKSRGNNKFGSDSQLIDFFVSYFSREFKYDITGMGSIDPGEDPAVVFLKRKKGHCELFATAMILVLRNSGIPCRYVTGFLCEEKNPVGDYYIARLGNAHAWVEAYLRDEKKWVIAEPTPPSGLTGFTNAMGNFGNFTDLLKTLFYRMMNDVKKGFFAKAIVDFFASLFSYLMDCILHPLYGTLILGGLAALFAIRRHRKFKLADNPFNISGGKLLISREFKKIYNAVSKLSGIPKTPGQTLNDWMKSQEEHIGEQLDNSLRDAVEFYQKLRFSQNDPLEDEIKHFTNLSREILASVKTHSAKQ